ncbi:hypothetical protein D3C80_1076780 [compost metagenome]
MPHPQVQAELGRQGECVAHVGVQGVLVFTKVVRGVVGVVGAELDPIQVKDGVDLAQVKLAVLGVVVLDVAKVQADGLGRLPVVAGVVLEFLARIVATAIVHVRRPGADVQATAVQQRGAPLNRRIAQGLRNATGAIVADGAQGDFEAEVVIEGQGLCGQGGQYQAGQGED